MSDKELDDLFATARKEASRARLIRFDAGHAGECKEIRQLFRSLKVAETAKILK